MSGGKYMTISFKNVYQFKISLDGSRPAIWRRIQVPETYTFWDLNIAIQNTMGWKNIHLSAFEIMNPKTSTKDYINNFEEGSEIGLGQLSWEVPLSSYFGHDIKRTHYQYDFGDSWNHTVVCEKICPREPDVTYPICLDGQSACPPEDCGGVGGYAHLIKVMKDPQHPHYEEVMKWIGLPFDPAEFNHKAIKFQNSQKCLELLYKV